MREAIAQLAVVLLLVTAGWVSPVAAQSDRLDGAAIRERRPEPPPAQQPPAEPPPFRPAPEVAPPAPEETLSFVLAAVVVEGATKFERAAFAPLYEDYLATSVTAAELQEIAARITAFYEQAGYVLSRAVVPAQTAAGGVVRIRVIEGGVARVRFEGNAKTDLESYAAAVTAETPLQLATLERALLLMNDLPGLTVADSRMRPIDEAEGTYELTVLLDEDRLDGSLYLDNRGTPDAGRFQLWTAAGVNSGFGTGERLQLAFFTVPNAPDELLYIEGSLTQPLGSDGLTLYLLGSASRGEAGADLALVESVADSTSLTTTLGYPLLRSRDHTLRLSGEFDFENAEEQWFDIAVSQDRLRSLRLRADYVGAGWQGTTFAGIELSRGLDILNASDGGADPLSRADGEVAYSKLRGYVTRDQSLGESFGVQLSVTGQVSADPLLAAEEFPLGGARFGRAYDYFEIAGEHGVGTAVELRHGQTLSDPFLSAYQVFGFYDWGMVWNQNVPETFADQRTDSLASLGAGVRVTLAERVRGTLEVARPLTRTPANPDDKNLRVFFSLSTEF